MNKLYLDVLCIDADHCWHERLRKDFGRELNLLFTTNLEDARLYIESGLFDRVISSDLVFPSSTKKYLSPYGSQIAQLCYAKNLKMVLLSDSSIAEIGWILHSGAFDFLEKKSYSPDFLMDKLKSDRQLQ